MQNQDERPTAEYPTRDSANSRMRNNQSNIGRTLNNAFDSFCYRTGSFLRYIPNSLKIMLASAVAYAIIDTAVFIDTRKHVHQHAIEYYNQLLDSPNRAINSLFENR